MKNYDKNRLQGLISCAGEISAFAKKVQPIYQMLNWKWANDAVYGIPTVDEIEQALRHNLDTLAEGNTYSGSGGLCAKIDDEGCVEMYLEVNPDFDKENFNETKDN
jgi:hypothetical protein